MSIDLYDDWDDLKTPPYPPNTRAPAKVEEKPTSETDTELRQRLIYIAGDTDRNRQRIALAKGIDLDVIAEEYNLRRLRNGK